MFVRVIWMLVTIVGASETLGNLTKHADLQQQSSHAEESVGVRYEQRCYSFTGGTCMTTSCDVERKASCQTGKCVCRSGCSSASGTCYSTTNEAVAEGITLKNAKWTSYKLYMQRISVFDQMKTTNTPSFLNMGQDKFSFYRLPGTTNANSRFFLGSDKWEDRVAALRLTTGTSIGLWGLYSVNLRTTLVPWKPQDIALTVCSLKSRGRPDAIMIGSSGSVGNPVWAYIKHGSWLVYGYSLGAYPGEGGYWIPTPSIPDGTFPDC